MKIRFVKIMNFCQEKDFRYKEYIHVADQFVGSV